MAIWERYNGIYALTTVGSDSSSSILTNNEDTDNFQNADLVVVDGILTLHTDSDDLFGFRLLIMDAGIYPVNEDDPNPHHQEVWYEWFVARGPMVFRLRSKRTLHAGQHLVVQAWKASGVATSANIHYGMRLLLQLKH